MRLTLRRLTTPANLVTLSRFPMAGVVWVDPRSPTWVGALVALAAVSDLLDGWLARRHGAPPDDLGAFLDPLADKAFVLSTLAAVWHASGAPVWLAVLAATREWLLVPLVLAKVLVPALRDRRIPWKAKALGKATTVAQFVLFIAALAGGVEWLPALAWLCALLGVGAGVQYLLRARAALAGRPAA